MKKLKFIITEEIYQRALDSNSGSCVVAEAIKEAYPELSSIKVDTAHVCVTDRELGERYMFLSPPSVVDTLIFFDQGWKEKDLPRQIQVNTLLRVSPITKSESSRKIEEAKRTKRRVELEEKEQRGEELTGEEKRSLARLQNPQTRVRRPSTYGPIKNEGEGVSRGRPIRVAGKHPNLLAGKDRHFGAHIAQPTKAFTEAVAKAVEEQLKKHE